MITLRENIEVDAPVERVFGYVSDFSNIDAWDPAVRQSRKTSPGKPGPGTRYRLKLAYAGVPVAMTYTVVTHRPPRKVVLQGRGDSFSALDTIAFTSLGQKTRIDYRADLTFSGMAAAVAPLFRSALDLTGRRAMAGLARAFRQARPAPARHRLTALMDRTVLLGLPAFTRYGYAASRRRFHPVTASLAGKTAAVTGATSGIGLAAATELARMGARLLIIARNPERAVAAKNAIALSCGNHDIAIYLADMGSLAGVARAAAELNRRERRLDILVNNAGALFPRRQVTAEGLEKSFATNLLGPFALTERLIPKLADSGPSRIVNVSSGGMYTQKIRTDDLQFAREPYDGPKAYARAKRGLVILTELWAERLADRNITVHAMHPGWVSTPGIQASLPTFHRWMRPFLRTPAQGADTVVWLSAAPEAAESTGRFWLDRTPRITHVFRSTRERPAERERLFEILAEMAGEGAA
jgi:NAD(P)-dependent dehydrogenase (short-subunit alcohol dehydrogenase family)/carbon monoxide dehydrogenase subunit G